MIQQYKDVFNNLEKLYWLPSYLAREDPHQRIIPPIEFVETLDSSANARAATMNSTLKSNLLQAARNENTIVLLLAGGGGNSLDEWARTNLSV